MNFCAWNEPSDPWGDRAVAQSARYSVGKRAIATPYLEFGMEDFAHEFIDRYAAI